MKSGKAIRVWYLLVLLVMLGISAAGCGRKAQNNGKHNIAVIVKSTQSAFWKTVFAGAGAAATEYNLDIYFEGPRMEEDYESQNRMIETAVRDGAEVIIFSAVDFNANAKTINYAAGKGIKIIVIDSDVNSQEVSIRIGTDNYAAGELAGEAALADREEELYVGIVNYDINSANGQQREQGFRNRIGKEERVKEIHTINVVSTTEDAKEGTKRLLEEYPNTNVIVTFNEWTSLGVGWAIRELKRGEDIHVVAFDSNVISVGMLETGEVDALVVQSPYAMGYLAVEAANKLLNNQKPEQSRVDTQIRLVTRENMFEADCQRMLFNFD